MIKAVFFDVANTLLDKPDLYKRMLEVLSRRGLSLERRLLAERHRLLSETITFPDKTSRDFYLEFNAELLLSLGIVPTEDLVVELFESCTYLPWQAFDDLECLSQITLPKGIISNWDKSLPDKLKQLVPADFQWILGSEEMQARKPSLEFYRKALLYANLRADEILYVGDSIKLDVQPALLLGIQAVLIDRLDLYPASSLRRIRRMSELLEFIR